MRMLFTAVLVLGFGSLAAALEVPFTVEEAIGAARECEVVSGGIPLPEGQYTDPAAFSLFDGGTEVPVQVSPMVKYPDGSLHWVLVSFPVKLGANEKKTFTLKGGAGKAAPANPVTVKEEGSKVTVSNGLVSFTIDRENFNGFEAVSCSGKEVFKAAKMGLSANGKGGPGKPTHFEYKYRGPVRVTMYLKGLYADQAAPTWSMAVTLNAGESRIRVDHSLRNGAKDAPKTLTISDPKLSFAVVGDLQAGQSGNAGGKSAAFGWQSFTGAADVLVFMRQAGSKCKGAYKADVADNEFAIHLGDSPEGSAALEYGAHKATEIDISFAKAFSAEALSEPLHALAACGWYAANDSMGVGRHFGSLADETATYKAQGWKNADDPKKMPSEKPDPTLYRASIGDVHFTTECDHLQGMVLGYVRTGQIGFLDEARSWARYWRTYFVYRSDEWDYGKDGSYKTPKWGDPSHSRVCTEGCHNYVAGLFDYALLTGDIDALEGAFDGAEFCNLCWTGMYSGKKPGDDFAMYGTRGFMRSYLTVARAYEVARTDQWKEALKHYVKMLLETPGRDPRGFTGTRKTNSVGSGMQLIDRKRNPNPAVGELMKKEGVEVVGEKSSSMLKHPTYGEWKPNGTGTWYEAQGVWACGVAYDTLIRSSDPADQVLAEDVMDYAIAGANMAAKYFYDPVQKAVYYHFLIDFPIPDMIPEWYGPDWAEYKEKGTDSWYTKWMPNVPALGYQLTGDKSLREKSIEMTWWGLSRNFYSPPSVPQGDAPKYAYVEKNTKGDWISPTCLVFGLAAFPKTEEAPPAAVTDLKAEAGGGGKVTLTWTAPGDEGGGKPVRYQVKWSEKPMVDYLEPGDGYRSHFKGGQLDVTYWNMATNVAGEPAPQAKGAKETMTLSVPAGKKLYFAVHTFDDSHNRSALSNVAEAE